MRMMLATLVSVLLLAACAQEKPKAEPTSWGPPQFNSSPSTIGTFKPINGDAFRPVSGMEHTDMNPMPGKWSPN